MRTQYEYYLNKLIDVYRSKDINGYVPKTISGIEIIEIFELTRSETDTFFNMMCWEKSVLDINPGFEMISSDWSKNYYGLKEPYLTQIRRDAKLNNLIK